MGFRKAMERMINAREKRVQSYVNSTLLTLDDEILARGGFDRAELKKTVATAYPF